MPAPSAAFPAGFCRAPGNRGIDVQTMHYNVGGGWVAKIQVAWVPTTAPVAAAGVLPQSPAQPSVVYRLLHHVVAPDHALSMTTNLHRYAAEVLESVLVALKHGTQPLVGNASA